MKFTPVSDRVLVLPDKSEQTTASGILLAENKEKPDIGIIVVGDEKYQEGARVLFSKFGFDEVSIEGVVHYVVSKNCILGYFTA